MRVCADASRTHPHPLPPCLSVWQPPPCGGLGRQPASTGPGLKPQVFRLGIEASSWKLDLLHGGNLEHRHRWFSWRHHSDQYWNSVSCCCLAVAFTCWYEVVYTMTFCCWPSAVMIPAGSGFADVGEKMDFNQTETDRVDLNPGQRQTRVCARITALNSKLTYLIQLKYILHFTLQID